MRAAIAMYTALNRMGLNRVATDHIEGRVKRLAEAEQELGEALIMARGTSLEGNVNGHTARLRLLQHQTAGRAAGDLTLDEQQEVLCLYERAVELNQQAGRKDPRSTVYWLTELGAAQRDFRMEADADETLNKALAMCDNHGLDAKCRLDLHFQLGKLYSLQTHTNKAEWQFEVGLRVAKEIGDGEMEEAIERELRAFDPGRSPTG